MRHLFLYGSFDLLIRMPMTPKIVKLRCGPKGINGGLILNEISERKLAVNQRASWQYSRTYPDALSSEKTSGKIGLVLQSDWSTKMALCKSRHHFRANCFQTFVLNARRYMLYKQ